uniref:Uncharacterized protein n=1 Tax=Arion vulgaris TaxID=1028688 RepID=A0A0B7AE51_9EUPU
MTAASSTCLLCSSRSIYINFVLQLTYKAFTHDSHSCHGIPISVNTFISHSTVPSHISFGSAPSFVHQRVIFAKVSGSIAHI